MSTKKFNIVNKFKWWISIPLAIILISMIVFSVYAIIYKDFTKGANIGIDFAGGSVVTVTLGSENLTGDKYEENLEKIKGVILSKDIANKVYEKAKEQKDANGNNIFSNNLTPDNIISSISYIQKSGKGEEMSLVVKYDNVSNTYDKDNYLTTERKMFIEEELRTIFSEENGYNGVEISANMIGATASANLIKTAILAVFITLILILIYIIIRFEIWSGLAAIIGLAHDVIFMFCLTIIFNIQINSAFIAAMITIVAYSINNTIVVFDRVRENMSLEKGLAKSTFINNNVVVEKAVWDTMLRSINSTLTTMLAIVLFAILGASAVREFALPVIFGLLGGFFSSLCLAPSLYCLMKNGVDKKKKNKINSQSNTKFAGVQ